MSSGRRIPLQSLTVLNSSASSVGWALTQLLREFKSMKDFREILRALYDAEKIENQLKEGDISYPAATSTEKGMKIEFQ